MNQKYFIGIDVSKGKLDCAVILSDYSIVLERVVKNNDQKIAVFLKALMKKLKLESTSVLVCCETTGIYNKPLIRVCHEMGIPLWVEHALKIKRAATDMRGKSDRKDALRIAEYAMRYQDKKVLHVLSDESIEILDTNCKARQSILEQKVALENQLREAKSHDPRMYKQLSDLFRPLLKAMKKSLKDIDQKINDCIEQCPSIEKNVELIQSVPGVGKVTAIQFVIITNNFNNFENAKHLACYAGVVPFANESGTIIKRPRISKMANLKLKTLLHLAAMAAIRTKTELKHYYIRKVKEGKNKMAVINAVRNKLVHRIWAVIERQAPYMYKEEFLSM
ncbi:MAG: IS110 family transposase [Flavobacteriales bacterium]|nr:IS110 family transposase [Flavobacteriales bacterium]